MPRKSKVDEDKIITEDDVVAETPSVEIESDQENKKESIFKRIFKKREKTSEVSISPKKSFKEKFATFFKLFISFGLTIVLTALISILVFNAIDKREDKTIYKIGDVSVPSYEYISGKAPIEIIDRKSINVENPTETITYKYIYDNAELRNANLNEYILKLKSENFAITDDAIVKTFDKKKTYVVVKHETIDNENQYILIISYSINL